MVYFNFVFFLILFLFFYSKRGMSSSSYISLIYMVSSFLSIFCYIEGDIRFKWDPSITPTLVYWCMTALTILPIYLFEQRISTKIIANVNLLKFFCFFYTFSFVLLLILYWQDFLFILASSDLGELRKMVLLGDVVATKYGGALGILLSFIRTINSMSFMMIPIFFILLIKRVRKIYLIMALIGSLSTVLQSFLQINRAPAVWWIVIFGWSLSFFKADFTKNDKKTVRKYALIVLGLLLFYIGTITISKFGGTYNSENKTVSSLISYGGQSYLNFCYFWDNLQSQEYSTRTLFPMTHHFIIGDYDGLVALQLEKGLKYNFDFGVFFTYLGVFLIDGGHIAPFIFVLFYLILFIIILKNFGSTSHFMSFKKFYILFCIMMIPTTGCIAYFYSSPYTMFSALFMLIIIHLYNLNTSKKIYQKTSYK